jgi:hypothetical protein
MAESNLHLVSSQADSVDQADDYETHSYVYVLIRTDIALEQQLVQLGHAAWEAGMRWHSPEKRVCSLIALAIPNKKALERAARKLTALGIEHHMFHEPDFGMGHSAIGTQPLIGDARQPLMGYPLWKARLHAGLAAAPAAAAVPVPMPMPKSMPAPASAPEMEPA